ncbi:MAG: hypothetical protein DI586_09800 [Micavibrio aeruginosavorus]|uniref:Uncharacterized protein n=1 Tax=Micavibrio aeruginosavorus TaxID=349221 RepID=A0A2W5HL31_9BACT|nr:MAG: hypothetical protein DI586_09800 [Micavibrio aeruginosavorus]
MEMTYIVAFREAPKAIKLDQEPLELTAQMECPEVQEKKPELSSKPKFSLRENLKSFLFYSAIAGSAAAINHGDLWIETNYGDRANWQVSAHCEISGPLMKGQNVDDIQSLSYHFTNDPQYKAHPATDLVITHSPRDAFLKCNEVLHRKGFELWNLEASFSKSIPGVAGMDGKKSSPIASSFFQLGLGDDKYAADNLERLSRESLNLSLLWKGIAFSDDWYLKKQLDAKQWQAKQQQAVNQKINEVRISLANNIMPKSP